MKKLIILSILLLVGCAGTQKGTVKQTFTEKGDFVEKGATWDIEGKGISELEFYPDGNLKRVKHDNKAEPFIKLNNISPKYEKD